MEALKNLLDFWPVILAIVGVIVWLVRLEGKVEHLTEKHTLLREDHAKTSAKVETLESDVFEKLSGVEKSLARIEGFLGVKNK